jgi:hypothetical protein
MSSVNSIYSSNSRITGMYSQLDIDALVESMCSKQQSKIDKAVAAENNLRSGTTRR